MQNFFQDVCFGIHETSFMCCLVWFWSCHVPLLPSITKFQPFVCNPLIFSMVTYIFLSKYIFEKLGTTSHIIDFILEFNYRVQLSVVLRAGLCFYLSQVSYGDSLKIRISVGSYYLYFSFGST